MKKICRCAKNRESHCQWHSQDAENRAAGLTGWCCDAGLTSKWFEATLLDVNGSQDLRDISMNVTECHCSYLQLQHQQCGASISEAWCC